MDCYVARAVQRSRRICEPHELAPFRVGGPMRVNMSYGGL